MEVEFSSGLLHRILALCAADPAREICGLLLGTPGHVSQITPAANVGAAPADSFEIDPAVHFAALRHARAGGPAVLGHYHSHPSGLAEPSVRDAAGALDPGQLWLIVARGEARLWRVAAPGRLLPAAIRERVA